MGGWNIAQIKTMIITYKKKLQNCQSWVALTLFKMFFVTQRNKMKSHIIVSCLVYPVLILCTHLSQVMPKGMQIYAFGSKITCEVVVFFKGKGGISTIFYSCSLATFYLLKLKYSWVNNKIKVIEKWLFSCL